MQFRFKYKYNLDLMGELGHVNIVIRAREQGVDCVLQMRTGNWKSVIFPTLLFFAVTRRKTYNLSQFTHLEIDIAFLF